MNALEKIPDFDKAQIFLDIMDPDGIFTFQTFPDNPDNRTSRAPCVLHGTFPQHKEALASLNAAGHGIFFMVNKGDGLTKSDKKTCRTNSNVICIRAFFLDLDGAPLEPVLKACPPDIVVESSLGKWHAYWLVSGCPLQLFKTVQINLAEKFNGDPLVNDLARVLRIPGFFHQKATPFQSRLVLPK